MENSLLKLVSISIFLSIAISNVSSEKILFLLPLSIKSHKIFFEPLINGLAAKGHAVTVLSNGLSTSLPSANPTVEELIAVRMDDFMKGYPEPFENMKVGSRKMAFPFDFILERCHKVIPSPVFQGIVKKDFDLIIVDSFVSGCLDGFIYTSGFPFILVTTMPAPSYISERVGNFLPPSTIPVLSFRGYDEPNGKMGFWQRLGNMVHFILARAYVNFVILPRLESVYQEYLGGEIPGILEIESRASMIFMNSHFSMNIPRPLLPDVVEIGGMHCGGRKTGNGTGSLNPALEKFISKAASPHGFIYFSVGSITDLDNAPKEFIQALLTAFSKLEQRVVLKWKRRRGGKPTPFNSTDEVMQIPKNVWISDWYPQQEILSHENIRLFISHGGLLSMQEAVYYGVPVLGLPFGLDQDTNLHNAVLQGYALKLDVNGLTEEVLSGSINDILNNSRYVESSKRISSVFRQRPISPLETALFWTDYVIEMHKQNRTSCMHSPARNLCIFQYYSYDILAFLLMCLSVLLTVVATFMIRLGRFLKGSRATSISSHKKAQ